MRLRSHARHGAACSGAVVRTSLSASNCVCNAVRRPFCSCAAAHASGEWARGDDAQRTTPHLGRARRPPKRATIPTHADGFAPAAAERRNARAYRNHMRQLCLELLLLPKREWSRPPADVNHNKSSPISALWWRVVGNIVEPELFAMLIVGGAMTRNNDLSSTNVLSNPKPRLLTRLLRQPPRIRISSSQQRIW
jgi:hypothetical protein